MSETDDRRTRNEMPRTTEYRTRHRWDGPDSLHGEIIEAVATTTDTDLDVIAAQYDIEQSRVIEKLFGTDHDGKRSYGLIRFTLGDALVTVHSDGRLVTELRDGRAQQSVAV